MRQTKTSPRLRPQALALMVALLTSAWPHLAAAETLSEVFEAARTYDAAFQAVKSSADAATHKAAQAGALNRPSVNLTGGYTLRDTNKDPGAAPGGVNSGSLVLQAKQSLYNRGNKATMAQADKSLDLAAAELQTAEQDLIVRSATTYFDVLAAQDALTAAQAGKKAIGEQLASAKRNFEVGTATITDTREAQARFDLATAQELVAENDLRTKRIALDQFVGRQGVTPQALARPVVLPVPTDSMDAWVQRTEESPTVRKARLAHELTGLEIDKAKSAFWPTADAVGNVTQGRITGIDGRAPHSGTVSNSSIGVQFAVPLYTSGALDARVKETVALQDKARSDLEAAKRIVAQGTRQAYYGVLAGLAQVKALEAAEASTKLAMEATQLGYKVGVRVNLDVLNAQTQLFNTQRDLAKARYDVLVNSLKLRQVAGSLTPDDLRPISGLIAPK